MSQPIQFTVTAQRDEVDEFIFYRGPSLDDAYAELVNARRSVDAGNTGYVSLSVSDPDYDYHHSIVFEETGGSK